MKNILIGCLIVQEGINYITLRDNDTWHTFKVDYTDNMRSFLEQVRNDSVSQKDYRNLCFDWDSNHQLRIYQNTLTNEDLREFSKIVLENEELFGIDIVIALSQYLNKI